MTDRKTILYAEDNQDFRRMLMRWLDSRFSEYDVETFVDGSSLEKRLVGNLENVALVIADSDMPIVGADVVKGVGGRIIEKYARKEEFRRVPFVLLYGGHEAIGKKALEDGAFAYLDKLDPIEKIMMTLNYALNPDSKDWLPSSLGEIPTSST